ncbi:MAG: polysaccharide biosynthesis/export family protein [Terriglobales bacterium]
MNDTHLQRGNRNVAVTFSKILLSKRTWLLPLVIVLTCWLPAQPATGQQNGTPTDTGGATQNLNALGAKPHDDTFIIGVDDLLAINVWKEPDITRSVPVRSDGMISLPLVGELKASGETPHQLEIAITERLKNYISEPEVTVIVQEIRSQKFNILGQVARPGSYPLTNTTTVLDAIAMAGGFKDFAKQKNIYVLRQNSDGKESRLDFNYKNVIKGKDVAQNIKLQPRDTIVIP